MTVSFGRIPIAVIAFSVLFVSVFSFFSQKLLFNCLLVPCLFLPIFYHLDGGCAIFCETQWLLNELFDIKILISIVSLFENILYVSFNYWLGIL